jgi:MarR family transcriptional regulator, 2-MHQ and catechol-resistance regulon repressor
VPARDKATIMADGRLQKELKKRRPFQSLAQEAVLNLFRTNDRIQIKFAPLFGRPGLTPS